jgi:hypothetical protein
MSLFGKGNWTRYAVRTEDLPTFTAFLAQERKLFAASAFAARTILLVSKDMDTTVGINPPMWPCGDSPVPLDQLMLDKQVHPHVARNLMNDEIPEPWELPETVTDATGVDLTFDRYWGRKDLDFRLVDGETDIFGFWLVLHSRAGLDDLNALKEHSAATSNGAPFKTLSTQAKKDISAGLTSDGLVDYIARTQAPVIIDFGTGDIWLGSNSKKLIDAFKFWMSRNVGLFIEKMELTPGSSREWPSLALSAMAEKDLFKLERQEAWEKIKNATEEDADHIDAMEDDGVDEAGTATPKDENEFLIADIATYAPDSGLIVNVGCDALIALGKPGMTSVLAKRPVDALTVLKSVETAHVAAARCSFHTPVGEGKGTVHVEVSALLNECNYKGLEIDLNVPALDKLQRDFYPDGPFPTDYTGMADKVNRFWMNYYLQLRWAENLLINSLCTPLELTPIKPAPRTMGAAATTEVLVPEEQSAPWTEDGPAGGSTRVKKAAKKMAKAMQENLLPGESITFMTPGKPGVTVHAKATETEIEI